MTGRFLATDVAQMELENLGLIVAAEVIPSWLRLARALSEASENLKVWRQWQQRRYYRQSAWLLTACIVLLSLT